MAGRATGKKAGGRKKARAKAGAPRRSRPVAPVLGNDPFERGAAVRAIGGAAVTTSAPSRTSASTSGRSTTPSPTPIAPPPPTPTPAPSPITTAAAALRDRLGSLEQRVEAAAGRAAERVATARDEVASRAAGDLRQVLASLGPALRDRLHALGALRGVLGGSGTTDVHGLDPELWRAVEPALDFLYGTWWRVATREVENVPAQGPLVVVANHGGALPWDALILRMALEREHPARRDLRALLDAHAFDLPIAGRALGRLGAVRASPESAQSLLGAGLAVAVFPEGSRPDRPPSQSYRLERFGRGGFAKVALRAGAPIVPCAIVGSEETSAPFARPGWLAEWLGVPVLGSATALPLAPLGLVPLPSRWSVRFGAPIPAQGGPSAADDAARVLELTERTREALQGMLDEDVAARRSIYL
ncbi:MAG TPA: lysophospholipid acyltransferase family protein [Anaeromyxobacteraceae bacterium]|nr:lysophospholipid acyltransferase family protein [Anaeromyxobacteraceae bacterium]